MDKHAERHSDIKRLYSLQESEAEDAPHVRALLKLLSKRYASPELQQFAKELGESEREKLTTRLQAFQHKVHAAAEKEEATEPIRLAKVNMALEVASRAFDIVLSKATKYTANPDHRTYGRFAPTEADELLALTDVRTWKEELETDHAEQLRPLHKALDKESLQAIARSRRKRRSFSRSRSFSPARYQREQAEEAQQAQAAKDEREWVERRRHAEEEAERKTRVNEHTAEGAANRMARKERAADRKQLSQREGTMD